MLQLTALATGVICGSFPWLNSNYENSPCFIINFRPAPMFHHIEGKSMTYLMLRKYVNEKLAFHANNDSLDYLVYL